MDKVVKGSILPIVVEITGLGDIDVGDAGVGLTLTFWSERPQEYDRHEPKKVTIRKGDEDLVITGDVFVALVDTSLLDVGRLCGSAAIAYTDIEIGKVVKLIVPEASDIMIVEPYTEE